jgi:hypothetical protein
MPLKFLTPVKTLAAILAGALVSACGTFVVNTGHPLSEAEAVTLKCFWRYYFVSIDECHVSAVDGHRPGALQFANITAQFPPGHRWVEFEMERYFGGGGGTTDVCAFEHDFLAGHRYQIVAHSFKPNIAWLQKHTTTLYTGSIDLEETRADGSVVVHRPALICSFGGSLCRTTADCVPHPDIICQPQPGYPYGRCGFKP